MTAIWIDGELVDEAQARISAIDHGVTVGDGVFETMKVVTDTSGERHAFALTRHLARLGRSARGLGLPVPVTDDELRDAVRAVLAANADAGRVRITLTGGVGPLGSDRGGGPPTVIVATADAPSWPERVAVATVRWRRNEHSAVADLKTTSYAENVVALDDARARGASEAIFANTAGNLCEGTGTNVFLVHDDVLVTPPLSSGCLAGITRELLLEITGATERDVPLSALLEAPEAFLTSSTRDVLPISRVDATDLPHCPGPRTRDAAAAFAALVARDVDP